MPDRVCVNFCLVFQTTMPGKCACDSVTMDCWLNQRMVTLSGLLPRWRLRKTRSESALKSSIKQSYLSEGTGFVQSMLAAPFTWSIFLSCWAWKHPLKLSCCLKKNYLKSPFPNGVLLYFDFGKLIGLQYIYAFELLNYILYVNITLNISQSINLCKSKCMNSYQLELLKNIFWHFLYPCGAMWRSESCCLL